MTGEGDTGWEGRTPPPLRTQAGGTAREGGGVRPSQPVSPSLVAPPLRAPPPGQCQGPNPGGAPGFTFCVHPLPVACPPVYPISRSRAPPCANLPVASPPPRSRAPLCATLPVASPPSPGCVRPHAPPSSRSHPPRPQGSSFARGARARRQWVCSHPHPVRAWMEVGGGPRFCVNGGLGGQGGGGGLLPCSHEQGRWREGEGVPYVCRPAFPVCVRRGVA